MDTTGYIHNPKKYDTFSSFSPQNERHEVYGIHEKKKKKAFGDSITLPWVTIDRRRKITKYLRANAIVYCELCLRDLEWEKNQSNLYSHAYAINTFLLNITFNSLASLINKDTTLGLIKI